MRTRKGSRAKTARIRGKENDPGHRAILSRIAARDKAALIELHARLAPGLMGLASQIALDPLDAAAAVEDSFVRLWREAPRFPSDTASVATWLVVMARQNAVERRRRKGMPDGRPAAPIPPLMRAFSWLPRPEDFDRLEARRGLLKKVMRQLPEPQRAALALAVWEGLNEEEIAIKLGEPSARVQSSIRAGMRFIRHRMRVVLGTWSAHI